MFIHEATHLSIDPYVYGQRGWNDAVYLDGNYLSTYAKENPESEDIAETFQAYIAVKYFPEIQKTYILVDSQIYIVTIHNDLKSNAFGV